MRVEVEEIASGAKIWNDEKYFAQKWWNLVEKYFSLEDCTIVLGPSWDLLGTSLTLFIKYLVIIFERVVLVTFGIFCAKSMKGGRIFFHQRVVQEFSHPCGACLALFWLFSWDSVIIFSNTDAWDFWRISRKDDKIMTELYFHAGPGPYFICDCLVDAKLYESLRRKPGWRFTAGV